MQPEQYPTAPTPQAGSLHEDKVGVFVPSWMVVDLGARDALLFAQILWWWRPSDRGNTAHRTRQIVSRRDEEWMFTTDAALGEEVGLSVDQASRARRALADRGLIECRSGLVRGIKQTLIRLPPPPSSEPAAPPFDDSAEAPDPEPAGPRDGSAALPDHHSAALPDLPLQRNHVEDRAETHGPELALVAAPLGLDWKVPKVMAESGCLTCALDLCGRFAARLEARGHKASPRSKAWVEPMEQMLRLDGIPPDRIAACIDWLDAGATEAAAFWRNNVLSPAKLRLQFSRMAEQAIAEKQGRRSRDLDRISGIAHVGPSDIREALNDARRARTGGVAPGPIIDATASPRRALLP